MLFGEENTQNKWNAVVVKTTVGTRLFAQEQISEVEFLIEVRT
jgi:hypothetical protein